MIDSLKRLFGFWDSKGLRYSQKHLNKVKHEIAFYPLEKQARYASEACVKHIDTTGYMLSCFSYQTAEILATLMLQNPTKTGDVAYVALHSSIESTRLKCLASLNLLKQYEKQFEQYEKAKTRTNV